MPQTGDGWISDKIPVDIKWGYNEKGKPVIKLYQNGKFIVQVEFTEREQKETVNFWIGHAMERGYGKEPS